MSDMIRREDVRFPDGAKPDINGYLTDFQCGYNTALCKMKTRISNVPAVDAVEVDHSVWSTARTWEHDGEPYCKNCGYAPFNRRDCGKWCPNCGARMDGGEQDE